MQNIFQTWSYFVYLCGVLIEILAARNCITSVTWSFNNKKNKKNLKNFGHLYPLFIIDDQNFSKFFLFLKLQVTCILHVYSMTAIDILVIANISTKCVSICSVISKILKYILILDLS